MPANKNEIENISIKKPRQKFEYNMPFFGYSG
jgi:hypothetical protein